MYIAYTMWADTLPANTEADPVGQMHIRILTIDLQCVCKHAQNTSPVLVHCVQQYSRMSKWSGGRSAGTWTLDNTMQ